MLVLVAGIQTSLGPVVRLYLEFLYQPYKFESVCVPIDIHGEDSSWAQHQLKMDDLWVVISDREGRHITIQYCIKARKQVERLRLMCACPPCGTEGSFESAVNEAESIWKARLASMRGATNESQSME